MKVSLVVASGVHEGKVIPISAARFLIGRDAHCQLRPASQAVSKQHCAFLIKDGRVSVRDFGSTNGTVVNGHVVKDQEAAVAHGDSIKVGPLDFTLRVDAGVADAPAPKSDKLKRAATDALAAVKAVGGETLPAASATVETPGAAPAPKEGGSKSKAPAGGHDEDTLAAMLLGMGDDSNPDVPGGSTVMEMPAPDFGAAAGEEPEAGSFGASGTKPAAKKPAVQTQADSSNAASELLKKMLRRPR